MTQQSLILVFQDAAGKKRNMRIDEPRSNLTDTEVQAAMNNIIEKSIFADSPFASALEAYIVTTQYQTIFEQDV